MSDKKNYSTSPFNNKYIPISFLILYSILRCFFETDLTDEAYYVSEAITVLSGNTPIAFNTSLTSGMSFIILPLLSIIKLINPHFTGIFLTLRLLFTIFRLIIIFTIYELLDSPTNNSSFPYWVLVLLPYSASINNQWSYNSISIWLITVSSTFIFTSFNKTKNKSNLFCFVSGVLSCLCFFAHAFMAVAILTQIVILLFYVNKENGVQRFISYSAGGLFQALIILIGVIITGGLSNTLSGIDTLLNHPFEQSGSWKISIKLCVQYFYKSLFIYAFIYVLCLFTLYFLNKNKNHATNKANKILLLNTTVMSLGITCFLHFFVNCKNVEWHFAGLFILISYSICFILLDDKTCMIILGFPITIFTVCEILFSYTNGPTTRFQFLLPLVIPMFYSMCSFVPKRLLRLSAVFVCAFIVLGSLRVYRDDTIAHLKYKVNDGIYKGLYTNKQRAHDLPEIENFIRNNTDDSTIVSFRDNAPFAYIMSNGAMCELSTWDCLQYSRNCNNPSNLYRYYIRKRAIPNTIIYIDFGTNPILSIDDINFKYNDYINNYYTLIDKQNLNSTFSDVRIYKLNAGVNFSAIDFDTMILD